MAGRFKEIAGGVYLVGGGDLSHGADCTPGHTPGSLAALRDTGREKILFGQDIHGPFSPAFRSDIPAWKASMQKLLALEADVLCEGHFGIFRPAPAVRHFIESQLRIPREMMPLPG